MRRAPDLAMTLYDTLQRASLTIESVIPRRRSAPFRARWREHFGPPHMDWRTTRFDWEALGTHRTGAVLIRKRAARELETQRHEVSRFFVCEALGDDIYEMAGTPPAYEWWKQELSAGELFLVDEHWSWTFVMTHEESMGFGPYFVFDRGEE